MNYSREQRTSFFPLEGEELFREQCEQEQIMFRETEKKKLKAIREREDRLLNSIEALERETEKLNGLMMKFFNEQTGR